MDLKVYRSAQNFFFDNESVMLERQAETNLLWGNANSGKTAEDGFFGARVKDGDDVFLAIRCDPYPLVCFARNNGSLRLAGELAQHLIETGQLPDSINGVEDAVVAITDELLACGHAYDRLFSMSLMVLERLNDIELPEGEFLCADKIKFDYAPFLDNFIVECNLQESRDNMKERAEKIRMGGNLYAWVAGGEVVSVAGTGRRTKQGCSVGSVYTPPEHRGMGYSKACVHELSKLLLSDPQVNHCFLYADKKNPVSNHVYLKLGYNYAGDFTQYMKREK